MDIKQTFLKLTRRTYPHQTEHMMFDQMPSGVEFDEFCNLFIKIGESDTMFTSHLDTATSVNTPVNHVIDEESNMISTDGKSILGADDKAGVTIMFYMIEKKIPGLYYFFLGEEVGCIGSKKVANVHRTEKFDYIKKVVSFDRRGTDSVITFQTNGRCCSDVFAKELAKELNKIETTFTYKDDPSGIYTDSAQFTSIYPECTNISVGYYNEHTYSERQDIKHLELLAEACCKVDWTSLPVVRDPSVSEYRSYGYGGYGWNEWGDEDFAISRPYSRGYVEPKGHIKKAWFYDPEFNYNSLVNYDMKTGEISKIDLHEDRILYEEDKIYYFLNEGLNLEYSTMKWDGLTLTVWYDDKTIANTATRKEMMEYIPELDLSEMYGEEAEEVDLLNSDTRSAWNSRTFID